MRRFNKVLTIAVLTGLSTVVLAHNHQSSKGYHHNSHHSQHCSKHKQHSEFSPQKREALMQLRVENKLAKLTQKFDLSAEQQQQVRTILQQKQQKMKALKQDYRNQIQALLTPEQKSVQTPKN